MKGSRFEVCKEGDRWMWELHKGSNPHGGPIARSGSTYSTKQTALKSIRSAAEAAGTPRVFVPEHGRLVEFERTRHFVTRRQ